MKKFLMNIGDSARFKNIRRKIVVFRSFMARAYSWVNVPGMVLVMVGVMYPYIKPHFNINMWLLALIILVVLLAIGYLERYLGFYKEDASYGTEQNRLLLKRLDTLEEKLDLVINGKQSDNQGSVQNIDS